MSIIPDPASHFEDGSSKNASDGRDAVSGEFLKGYQGGSRAGRKRGSRAKLGEKFLAALHEDFEQHGVEAIARVRFLRPDVYVQVLAKILPQKIEISTPTDGMTDERLAEMLEMAERMVALKTIEGTAVDVTPRALAAPITGPTLKVDQEREALRVDLRAQHDRIEAVGAVKQAIASIPHPVGRPHPRPDHEVERINRAKLHDDGGDIDPASLF